MARHITPPVLAIILIALTCSAFAGDETGEPATRFRAKTTTGEQFNNASVKGQVVVFEFWTTWCKYCEAEASMMDDIALEFRSKDLIVLAVDVLEPDQKVKKYLVDHPRGRCRSFSPETPPRRQVQRAGLSDLPGD